MRCAWHRLQLRPNEMFVSQSSIHCRAFLRILRTQRAASDQEARSASDGVLRDPAPEEMEQVEIPMRDVHTRATELDDFAAHWFVGREIKLSLAVVTPIRRRQWPCLQTIRSDDVTRRDLFNDQVIAAFVERIGTEPVAYDSARPSPNSRLKTSNRNR